LGAEAVAPLTDPLQRFTNLADFPKLGFLDAFKRILVFELSRLLFPVGGERTLQFAVDLRNITYQLAKTVFERFGDFLMRFHIRSLSNGDRVLGRQEAALMNPSDPRAKLCIV
jgi:hypothetical protein